MDTKYYSFFEKKINFLNFSELWKDITIMIAILLVIVLICFVFWWVSRKLMVLILHTFVHKSKTKLDDYLLKHRFFAALANLIPLFFMEFFLSVAFFKFPRVNDFFTRFIDVFIICIVLVACFRFFNAVRDNLKEKEKYKDKPIEAYFQISKIVFTAFSILLITSILFNITITYLFTGLGAMTAVILLIFKDSILGFVGSVQLSINDMIRIGDWITMKKYGADGNVQEINLTTVKVQNFDKTITTIPTYSLISDAFKNWRGMENSEGRRIARGITIKIDSIRFADKSDLEEWKKINVISEFITSKEKEILEWNKKIHNNEKLNIRQQTNIGIYRKYLEYYLQNHSKINSNMTLIVRQLAPEENGVPLQLYCFSKYKEWISYEAVVSDIFDHIFATISFFDLKIYEKPSSTDLKKLSLS